MKKVSFNHSMQQNASSCKISLKYVDRAITSAPGYGGGFGPLNHLVSLNFRNKNA